MGEMIRNQLVTMVQDTAASLITWTPRLLGGVILLVGALVVAKIVARVLRTMLTKLKLGAAMQRLGVDDVLKKIGIVQPLDTLLPRVVYYLLLVLVARTLADSLGLKPVSDAIAGFFAYLPNVFSAVIILIFGSIVAQLAGSMVSRAARESGIDFAASLGSLVSALIIFVLGIMAVGQLRIDTEIIRLVITCVLSGIALAFGLSFGLGTRDITRNLLAGFYARKIFSTGKEMEIRGERGVLRSITPTQTLLVQKDDTLVAVSNASFLEDVVKQ